MAKKAKVVFRVSPKIKEDFKETCMSLGIDISTALRNYMQSINSLPLSKAEELMERLEKYNTIMKVIDSKISTRSV